MPEPVANVRGELQSLERVGDTHNIVRLLRWGNTMVCSRGIVQLSTRYVPGRTLYEIDPWTTAHFYQCGEFVAKMDLALASFNHPGRTSGQTALLSLSFSISGYENRNSIWYLNSIPDLKVSIFGDIFRKFPEVKNSPSRCG